ncbi:ACT domain-containing protein [Sedimentibacter sp.]|uniref:ACT domain-containing protein n=1 Tax=Sedimentibacter sp. TaxID=1960295 RepID=UPI0028AD2550|nr:ACT domain-containing protein [Sedimentibacter sp.]
MNRTISFKMNRGIDSAVRVLTTLRRKQFDVQGFSMVSTDGKDSEFKITLADKKQESFEKAMLQMCKFVDVYDVSEAAE